METGVDHDGAHVKKKDEWGRERGGENLAVSRGERERVRQSARELV